MKFRYKTPDFKSVATTVFRSHCSTFLYILSFSLVEQLVDGLERFESIS